MASQHKSGAICGLKRTERLIGPMDPLIAARALALGCVLIANNEREFRRVEELHVENWLQP